MELLRILQQIQYISKQWSMDFDLLWTCCNVAANHIAIDLSKAFDKVNHNALYIKLMERHIPVELLNTLFSLFSYCWTCIKWKNVSSSFFNIAFGVRQGSVLSPRMFSLYINDVVQHLHYREHFYADVCR